MISRLRQVRSDVLVPRWAVVLPATLILVGVTVLSWEAGPESRPFTRKLAASSKTQQLPADLEAPSPAGIRHPAQFRVGAKPVRVPDRHLQDAPPPISGVLPPASAEPPLALAISAMPSGAVGAPTPAQEPEPMEEFMTAMEMGEVEQ